MIPDLSPWVTFTLISFSRYRNRFKGPGHTSNPTQISNQLWQTSRPPVTHTRSATLNGPATLNEPFSKDNGSIRTAPIPPSHSEGQSYFYNTGEGRTQMLGGDGRKA